MSEIVHVTTHVADAVDRLPEQFKGLPNMEALATISGERAQDLEDVFYEMLSHTSIADAYGILLDQIGDLVGQPRNGFLDPAYRVAIFAKIGQNVSKGTAENLISIYKLLMQADRVYFNPLYPAGATLTAIGGTPLGSTDDIKAAMKRAKMGGVKLEYFASASIISFSFSDDPDLNGAGFGDATDGTVGGDLASVL